MTLKQCRACGTEFYSREALYCVGCSWGNGSEKAQDINRQCGCGATFKVLERSRYCEDCAGVPVPTTIEVYAGNDYQREEGYAEDRS